jgi:hypothetical protein
MRLRRVGLLTAVLGATAAAATQGCEDDSSGGGAAFDGSAGSFDAGSQDGARADVTPLPSPDATVDATVDAIADATVEAAVLNDGSAPAELLEMFDQPRSLAIDATFLYVATETGVYRVAKDGTSSVRVTLAEDVNRITRDGTRIFFTTDTDVKVVPANAVDGAGEVSLLSGDAGLLPLRVSAGSIYYGVYASASGTTIRAIDEDGGNPRLAASGLRPYDFAAVGNTLFAPASGVNPPILQLPGDGGAGTSRATAVGQVSDFAVRDGYVYWSTRGGTVMRIPAASGAAETIATGEGPVAGIAVDDTHVYWVRYEFNSQGRVRRAPKTGGVAPITLAAAQQNAFTIAVDDTHVYWGAYVADGGVNRVPK